MRDEPSEEDHHLKQRLGDSSGVDRSLLLKNIENMGLEQRRGRIEGAGEG